MLTSDDKCLAPMDLDRVQDKGKKGKGKTKDGQSKGKGKDYKGGKGKGYGGKKGYESWNKEGCGKGKGEKLSSWKKMTKAKVKANRVTCVASRAMWQKIAREFDR